MGDDKASVTRQDQAHVATWGGQSPSVARSLSPSEGAQIIAIARALPNDWCVTIEPPYGQLSIGPLLGRRRYHRALVASPAFGRITRDSSV